MIFSKVSINEIFFENETGEYYKKINSKESVVIDNNTGKLYHDLVCTFPPNHEVEEPE